MRLGDNVYFAGDSHAADFAITLQIENHTDLGGYGLFSMFDPDSLRQIPDAFQNGIKALLSKLDENSTLILSYMDADCRIGIGERAGKQFTEYYDRVVLFAFEFLKQYKYKNIILLDMYSIAESRAPEMTCSVEKRVANRKLLNSLIQKHKKKYKIKLLSVADSSLFVNENGVLKNNDYLRDAIHYNLDARLDNKKMIKKELVKRIKRLL